MTYATIKTELEDGLLIVTLNRPERMNSFTVQMVEDLEHVFGWVNTQDDVKAVIVTGAGKAFCAGMDLDLGSSTGNAFGLDETLQPTLEDMRERLDDPVIAKGLRDGGGRVALAIYDCLKPVIGAVNGAAVGAGATITLPMDIRLASSNARFGFVFAKIGIVPEACSTWFLPRVVGLPKALEWFYSAEILNAGAAHAGGLVKEVLAPEDLLPTAKAMAHRIVDGRSPVSLALIRQMTWRNSALSDPHGAHEVDSLAEFYLSMADGKEGVQAFLEKRPPQFTSRVSTDMPPFYPWWSK
jgi:enoyl-CoA hydratase/carnithine racemase